MRPGRQVRRLFDLEIDEVSLVDKPANQFGKVAFSKRAEDGMPHLYDLDGIEVSEDELEHGETVTDDDGNEFVYLEEGTPEYDDLAADVEDSFDEDFDDYEDADDYDDADALAGVGKAVGFRGVGRMRGARLGGQAEAAASRAGSRAGRAVGSRAGAAAGTAYRRSGAKATGRAANRAVDRGGRSYRSSRVGRAHLAGSERMFQAGNRNTRRGRNAGRQALGRAQYLGSAVGFGSYAHPGATAAAAGATGYGVHRARSGRPKKNFGASVYEELSKALTQSDRDEAISKAMDVIDDLSERYQELEGYVAKMADDRALEDFSNLAREYGPLPVHPTRLGAIMKRASDTLPAADVEILDRLFSSVGEQMYTEFGKGGTGDSLGVFDQVDALADDVVSKSDLTREQAITAIFTENPDAYEEYLTESGQAGR